MRQVIRRKSERAGHFRIGPLTQKRERFALSPSSPEGLSSVMVIGPAVKSFTWPTTVAPAGIALRFDGLCRFSRVSSNMCTPFRRVGSLGSRYAHHLQSRITDYRHRLTGDPAIAGLRQRFEMLEPDFENRRGTERAEIARAAGASEVNGPAPFV